MTPADPCHGWGQQGAEAPTDLTPSRLCPGIKGLNGNSSPFCAPARTPVDSETGNSDRELIKTINA